MITEGVYSPEITAMIVRWEADQTLTPEELCRECPEHLYNLQEAFKDSELGKSLERWAGVASEPGF